MEEEEAAAAKGAAGSEDKEEVEAILKAGTEIAEDVTTLSLEEAGGVGDVIIHAYSLTGRRREVTVKIRSR